MRERKDRQLHARFDEVEASAEELSPKVEALARARFLYR